MMNRFLWSTIVFLTILVNLFANGGKQANLTTETPSITVEVFDRGTDGGRSDPTKNNWTDWIQEKVMKDENIKVTFIPVPRTQETSALNVMMAAGNAPDLCLTYNPDFLGNYRDLGGLYDLAPFRELLPDLRKFLGPDLAIPGHDLLERDLDIETGKMYSIPARRMITARNSTFIRKDWLDKLGLKPPATKEEYFNALLAFKERDPGNVGKDKVIPFTSDSTIIATARQIMGAFWPPNLSDKDIWINTVIRQHYELTLGYKEAVRYLNKMYNAGLIDRDFPLGPQSHSRDNTMKSGLAGSYVSDWDHPWRTSPGIERDLQRNVPGASLIAIDPFANSEGKTVKHIYDPVGVLVFVPHSAKYPEAVMRYLNWLSRFENNNFLQIGPVGIIHDLVNGLPQIKAVAGLWIQNSPLNIDYTIPINGLDLGDSEKNNEAMVASYPADPKIIIDAYKLAMKDAKAMPVIPVTLSTAGPYTETLENKSTVFLTNAIAASPGDFDKIWDDGIKDWLDSGARVILEERKAKYKVP
jgi:putative aldouronate transport system substrate-binding protein